MLLNQDRINKGPASRRKAYSEAFAFCKFVLNVDEITASVVLAQRFATNRSSQTGKPIAGV